MPLMLGSISTFAQSISLKGQVTDTTSQPLAFALVISEATGSYVTTDSVGLFQLNFKSDQRIPLEGMVLSVSCLGYATQQITIRHEHFESFQSIKLWPKPSILEEVVVTAKQKVSLLLQPQAEAVSMVSTEHLSVNAANINDALQYSSGIKVRLGGGEGGNNQYMINGLSGNTIRIYWDDIPFEYSGYGKMPVNIPLGFASSVNVYKGVLPVRFGADALGGVIEMKSDNANVNNQITYEHASFKTHKASLALSDSIGQKWILGMNAFFTSSANNYYVGKGNNTQVFVADELGRKQFIRVRNFHNAFQTYLLRPTLSFQNNKIKGKAWTSYASLKKEIQHNRFDPTIVVGEAFWTDEKWALGGRLESGPSAGDKFSWLLNYSYTYEKLHLIDTSKKAYNWKAALIDYRPVGGEILNYAARPFNSIYYIDKYFLNGRLIYTINKNHHWITSSTLTVNRRRTVDDFRNISTTPSRYMKIVAGTSLKSKFLKDKLQNIVSLKYYQYTGQIAELDGITAEPLDNAKIDGISAGCSEAISLRMSDRSFLKASYEYATRLPDPNEILGNGFFSFPTIKLLPERSHNLNLSLTHQVKSWVLATNFFYRKTRDLIILLGTDFRNPTYENRSNVVTRGIEFAFDFRLFDVFQTQANITWQDLRYRPDRSDHDFFLYNDQLPNTPYLFANFSLETKKEALFNEEDQAALRYHIHYTHEYFLLWKSQGTTGSKNIIPEQWIHQLNLTYRHQNFSYAAEAHNLFNSYAYDHFMTQLPGRSFHLKITRQLFN